MKVTIFQTYVPQKIKNSAKVIFAAILTLTPAGCGKDQFVKDFSTTITPIVQKYEAKLSKSFADSLKVVETINCRGGATHSYSDSSLSVLRTRLVESGIKTNYTMPVDTLIKPYIPSTGQFGSLRPAGRAHLGIDIYPRLYGRKPKEPVAVLSATDGIVVSVKRSPEKDPKNLIANNIKVMSSDGKIYSYDHLGRPEDYKNAKYTPLKKLGEVVHAGDTLGTVGKTGETDVWHLHFSVEDADAQKIQEKSAVWKNLFKRHSVYATPRGQVDPLDSSKAGDISMYLNKYKIDRGEKVSYVRDL